jgi:hypothetical protein
MSYTNILPENLRPADSLGSIFKTVNLKYEYANLSVLHSEIQDQVLKCLSFDSINSEAIYLNVPLKEIDEVKPKIFSRSFTLNDFEDCLPYSPIDFKANYSELFEHDLESSELEHNELLHFHLFGISSIYSRKKDVSNSIELLESTTFKYPGSDFYRIQKIYHCKRNKVLKTNEIILLLKKAL